MNSAKPRIWALTDGRAGNVAMALGLAERVAGLAGADVVQHRLEIDGLKAWLSARFPWFPSRLQMATYPEPHLVIGAGRRVAPAVAVLRAQQGIKAVQILNPQMAPARFDLVVAPEHDGLNAPNVVSTLGSVNRVTATLLSDSRAVWQPRFAEMRRPLLAVLIGGATKRTPLADETVGALAQDLRVLSEQADLLITASRRTGEAQTAKLRAAVPDAWFWDGAGENPYFGMLACADAIVATDDSVNMASEATATGKPLALYPLLREDGKIARFHEALIARGHAQWFDGAIPTQSAGVLDETGRAAQAVAALLNGEQGLT